MTRRHPAKSRPRHSAPPQDLLATIRNAPASTRPNEPNADLPGVSVMEVQVDLPDFWREWNRARRAAGSRVPALLARRRRSRLLVVIAAEDIPCLVAAIRAVQERLD